MDTNKIDSMLKNQANKLYAKGIAPNSYHKIILPIIFIKFLTSKVEEDWINYKDQNKLKNNSNDFEDYLSEASINENFIQIDHEFLWSNILKTSTDKIKSKLDGVFKSLAKYEDAYKDMAIFNFSSSEIKNSSLTQQVEFIENNYHDKESSAIDLFGYIYEFFLETYNIKQGRGGEFYTPHSIVKMMVHITENRIDNSKKKISIYDPTMGSGGMLTQSLDFLKNNKFDIKNIQFCGQEILRDTWNMSRMNFLLRSQSWNFGKIAADTFLEDQFPGEKFDIILSNPPFNLNFSEEDYSQLTTDVRFSKYGLVFGSKNANYNFFTHIISHLSCNGIAAVLMQPAAGQTTNTNEISIRRKYLNDNLVEAIINLPQNIFVNSGIGANIWVFNKNKKHNNVLFVDLSMHTIKNNKIETIPNDVIFQITELFNNFESYDENKKITSLLPYAIVKNELILQNPNANLNINEHIQKVVKTSKISNKEIAQDLKELKQNLTKTFEKLEKTIDYLTK